MAGTKEGAKKAKKTLYKKHGKGFFARIGRIGGRNGHTGGFASMPPEKVKAAGRKGGKISRRGKAKNK